MILDVEENGMKIPKVEYEVYKINQENNLIKLNLNVCKNNKIEISIPIEINDNIDIYNSSSGYYNDICYITTSVYGTDISLKDRRKEFIDNNLTLCEENCILIDYDYIYKSAKCSCEVKIELPLIEDIKFDKEKLKNNFVDINNIVNLECLKCYKSVFKKHNIIKNYGFYILNFIFLLYFICIFLFYFKFYYSFFLEVENIFLSLKNYKNENIETCGKSDNILNQMIKKAKIIRIKKKVKVIKNGKIIKFEEKIENKKCNSNDDSIENKRDISNNNNSKSINEIIFNKEKEKEKEIKFKKNIFNNETNKEILFYTDSELNSLSYKEALKYDKRSYFEYYFSLLKENNLLLFSFYPNKDYNSRIIKMFLFFYFFGLDLTLNALFFNDSTIHKIYEDKGNYNFVYQIPQIVYSTLLSLILNIIIKYFSLTEEDINDAKEEKRKNPKNFISKSIKIVKKIKIKFAIFFIVAPIILFFLWFYICCFCGVYKNTQIHLIKDSLISLLTSIITPFFTLLLPGIFRISALRSDKKNKAIMYKISKIFEMF